MAVLDGWVVEKIWKIGGCAWWLGGCTWWLGGWKIWKSSEKITHYFGGEVKYWNEEGKLIEVKKYEMGRLIDEN